MSNHQLQIMLIKYEVLTLPDTYHRVASRTFYHFTQDLRNRVIGVAHFPCLMRNTGGPCQRLGAFNFLLLYM